MKKKKKVEMELQMNSRKMMVEKKRKIHQKMRSKQKYPLQILAKRDKKMMKR
jgi:hypothetical protein